MVKCRIPKLQRELERDNFFHFSKLLRREVAKKTQLNQAQQSCPGSPGHGLTRISGLTISIAE